MTTMLDAGVNIRWLEQQTGEDYVTLKKHYSGVPLEIQGELTRLSPALFGTKRRKLSAHSLTLGGQFPFTGRNFDGFEMVPRGFEPLLPT